MYLKRRGDLKIVQKRVFQVNVSGMHYVRRCLRMSVEFSPSGTVSTLYVCPNRSFIELENYSNGIRLVISAE